MLDDPFTQINAGELQLSGSGGLIPILIKGVLDVSPALLILGDMSVQGNTKPLRSLTEPLQEAKDNGAKRTLIPIENKRNFLHFSADIMEPVDPVLYGDAKTGVMKVVGTSKSALNCLWLLNCQRGLDCQSG